MIKKNLKTLFCGHKLLLILTEKKLLEYFTKGNCKRQIKKNLEWKKNSKEKLKNYMFNGNVTINLLTVGLIKKDIV